MKKFVIPIGEEAISKAFYEEIWSGNEYNQFGICVEKGDIVLDAGSHIGIFTDYALFNGAKTVFSFEAREEIYSAYVENFPTNSLNVISKLGKIGVGDNCLDFRNIFDSCGVDHFDFAKLDIEGYEYDLLLNTPDVILEKVNKWAIEFHLWGYWDNTATEMKLMLKILEKFNNIGFDTYIKHMHTNTNLYMVYAKKNKL